MGIVDPGFREPVFNWFDCLLIFICGTAVMYVGGYMIFEFLLKVLQ